MALSKEDREAGYRMAPQPSPLETRILSRIARGFLMVTQSEKGTSYCYDDGTPIRCEGIKRGQHVTGDMDGRDFQKLVRNGWILPIEGEALFEGGPAQRYRARSVNDPIIPKVYQR